MTRTEERLRHQSYDYFVPETIRHHESVKRFIDRDNELIKTEQGLN